MSRYLIMGAGNQAYAMASHIIQNGDEVNIWNISEDLIETLKENKEIICNGIVQGNFKINQVSTNIDDVLCDTIFIATPATGHKPLAKILAKKVSDKNTIIISPGRTFGIIEFIEELKRNGCKSIPKVAELQTIIYTCRKKDNKSVELFALKNNILISTINNDLDKILSNIPKCISCRLKKANSFIETSLGNVGMILHCAPVLMNIGWIESNYDFKYYREGISKTLSDFLEELDKERITVASKLGYKVESVTEWMKRVYDCVGDNLYEVIQNNDSYKDILAPTTIKYRYLEEDIPYGLVPMESVANLLNIELKLTTTLINLANIIMKKDYRKTGRIINNIEDYLKGKD